MNRDDWTIFIVSGILIGAAIWVVLTLITLDANQTTQCAELGGVFIEGHCLRIEEIPMP